MITLKKYLAIAIVAIATVAAGFYSYNATLENQLAQVELSALEANIEALTKTESGAPIFYYGSMRSDSSAGRPTVVETVYVDCYDSIDRSEVDNPNSSQVSYSYYAMCRAGDNNRPCDAWSIGRIAPNSGKGKCFQYVVRFI